MVSEFKTQRLLMSVLLVMHMGVGCGDTADSSSGPVGEKPSNEAQPEAREPATPMVEMAPAEASPADTPDGQSVDNSNSAQPSSCVYTMNSGDTSVCQEFLGSGWTNQAIQERCDGRDNSSLSDSPCPKDGVLSCLAKDGEREYRLVWSLGTTGICAMAPTVCSEVGGTLSGMEGCDIQGMPSSEGTYDPNGPAKPGVFQPFEFICQDPNDEQPGLSEDGKVCTWQSIGGCTEPGRKFWDYASCEPILTQRPYFPVPASDFKTPDTDPLHTDEAYQTELNWVKAQAEACGCVCCHTNSITPSGAGIWDTEADGIWTDSFTTRGLAMAAGWVDSSALGAHDSTDNNGFIRNATALPTTDVQRMVTFFEGELARRGATRGDFADESPIGGPIYTQSLYQPEACERGEGVERDGRIVWPDSSARYVYVLEAGSKNPGVPPNMDLPEGVIWRLDVRANQDALSSGIVYGDTPEGTDQGYPAAGGPTPLVTGTEYYLYVLADIGLPITRCLFTYPSDENMPTAPVNMNPEGSWNAPCQGNDDCDAATGFCAKQPGAPQGYCTAHCDSLAACQSAGAPADWTCNAISCDLPDFTWCGPRAEIEMSGGFLKVCE